MKHYFRVQEPVISNNLSHLNIYSEFDYDADKEIYIINQNDGNGK